MAACGRPSSSDSTPRSCTEAPRMSRRQWRGQLRAAGERCPWQQKTWGYRRRKERKERRELQETDVNVSSKKECALLVNKATWKPNREKTNDQRVSFLFWQCVTCYGLLSHFTRLDGTWYFSNTRLRVALDIGGCDGAPFCHERLFPAITGPL